MTDIALKSIKNCIKVSDPINIKGHIVRKITLEDGTYCYIPKDFVMTINDYFIDGSFPSIDTIFESGDKDPGNVIVSIHNLNPSVINSEKFYDEFHKYNRERPKNVKFDDQLNRYINIVDKCLTVSIQYKYCAPYAVNVEFANDYGSDLIFVESDDYYGFRQLYNEFTKNSNITKQLRKYWNMLMNKASLYDEDKDKRKEILQYLLDFHLKNNWLCSLVRSLSAISCSRKVEFKNIDSYTKFPGEIDIFFDDEDYLYIDYLTRTCMETIRRGGNSGCTPKFCIEKEEDEDHDRVYVIIKLFIDNTDTDPTYMHEATSEFAELFGNVYDHFYNFAKGMSSAHGHPLNKDCDYK